MHENHCEPFVYVLLILVLSFIDIVKRNEIHPLLHHNLLVRLSIV
jgi:hypothetical protein